MAGLLERLFGRKSAEDADAALMSQKTSRDFYLSPDEAKTLGDIEFMRTPKKIHHTFHNAEGEGNEKLEFFDEVSSLGHVHSSSKH